MKHLAILATLALAITACAGLYDTKPAAGEASCIVTGCSSHLCVENTEANRNMATTCEYREAYGCYGKHGTCEKQAGGQCGWTPNRSLNACLKNAR